MEEELIKRFKNLKTLKKELKTIEARLDDLSSLARLPLDEDSREVIKQQQKNYIERANEIIKEQAVIEKIINMLENPIERCILVLRYIKCKKWNDIRNEVGYENTQMYRYHDAAMSNIIDVMEENKWIK